MSGKTPAVREALPVYVTEAPETGRVPEGYKHTEMGVIPDDWESTNLGNVVTLQRGYDLPQRVRRPGTVPIVSSSGIYDTHNQSQVCGPGVVTGRYGTVGEVFFVEEDFWPLNTTLFVKDFKGNDPLFIAFLLRTIDFQSHSGKSGVPGVNRNDLHGLAVGVPPLSEQRAIAAALSDVDVLIAALNRLISKKRAVKAAAMQQLLTGKQRLPGFSGEWEMVRLGTYLRFQVGFAFSSSYFNQREEGVRLVKNRDLKADDQVFYYDGPYEEAFVVNDGDVLVGMDGDFLPCLWQKGRALLNQRVGRVLPSIRISPLFAYYALAAPLKDIEEKTSSTTVKHLSHSNVANIEIYLPPLAEQTAIATVLSDMDAEISALEARREKMRQLKQGMMQELLTGRTRLVPEKSSM